ncbi:MAG: hypothetical protein Q9187_003245 [Circinaria calcarea]
MRFTVAASTAALVAGASANHLNTTMSNTTIYTTEVVTAYTTYCPAPTEIVHGTETYVVTEATTLTITNCPCTVTMPVITSTATYCPTCPASSVAAPVYTSPIVSGGPISSAAPYPTYINNSTMPAGTGSPGPIPATTVSVGSGSTGFVPSPSGSAPATFTGAANQAFAASGAGLAGLLGLAAFML